MSPIRTFAGFTISIRTALMVSGKILREEAWSDEGRQRYIEALDIFRGLGENGAVAEAQVELAKLDLDEGNAAAAEGLARQASAEFEKEGRGGDVAMARSVEALANLDAKHARALLKRRAHYEDRLTEDFVRTAAARIMGVTGNVMEARQELESLINETTRLGLVRDRLEAELALAEIGKREGTQVPAEALQDDLKRIAERAQAASRR